jgi:hypothetical protein
VLAGAAASRPDQPGDAIAVVMLANLGAAMAAVPLMGAAFSLPGDGRIGFAVVAGLMLLAILAVPGRWRALPST